MNDRELDLALADMGARHTRVSIPPALRQQARAVPLQVREQRSWLPQIPKWGFQSMFSATKFVVAGVIVALFGGFLLAGVLTQQSDESVPAATTGGPGTFSPAGSLDEARFEGYTATLLPDGRVLVVGGHYGYFDGGQSTDVVASAEVWDPVTASFSPAGSLIEGREGNTATLLPDGRVLIIGGRVFRDGDAPRIAAAVVWDPVTASFSPAGTLSDARWHHSATLLPDGRVLVVGGHDGDRERSAEVWDPATASFSPAGTLAEERTDDHTATLLPDGRVLIIGGPDDPYAPAEVWDPVTASFGPAGSLIEGRSGHTTTLLPDGRVLVVGGAYLENPEEADGFQPVASAEIWDPDTASFSPAGTLTDARWNHSAMLLPDGGVLVVGGDAGDDDLKASAEVWDPATASFSPAGSLVEARLGHTTTLLPDGRVLVVGGGVGGGERELASAEIWDPATASFSPAGSLAEVRAGHTATLLPDGRVLIVGGDVLIVGDRVGQFDTVAIALAEVWEPGA